MCDPQFLEAEISYIKLSLKKLAYPSKFIDSALSQAKRRYFNPPLDSAIETDKPNVLVLPYTAKSLSVRPLFKSFNTRIVNRTCNSIKKQLVHTKPKLLSDINCGTYVVPCGGCDRVYVGETGRPLSVRVKEHRSNVRFARTNSAIYCHVRDTDHCINWDSAKLVFKSNSKPERLLIESSLIKKLPNMNAMPGVCSVDAVTRDILLHSNRHIMNNLPPPYSPS